MATSVSMTSPISDYGNFGAVASQNWQGAQERALKEDLHKAEMDLSWDQHYLEEDRHDLDTWWNPENAKISWDQQKVAWDEQEIKRGYFENAEETHNLQVKEHAYQLKQREKKKENS